MKTFKEFLAENKDAAKVVRDILKKELKLSSKDVSVKSDAHSIKLELKTIDALYAYDSISKIINNFEKYDTDKASGEILQSISNTYTFINISDKLETYVADKLQDELVKFADELSDNGKIDVNKNITLTIAQNLYTITVDSQKRASVKVKSKDKLGESLLSLIKKNNMYSILSDFKL